MNDRIDAPKITVTLKTGQKPNPEAPPLRFLRWKPMPVEVQVVESNAQEEESPAEPTRTP